MNDFPLCTNGAFQMKSSKPGWFCWIIFVLAITQGQICIANTGASGMHGNSQRTGKEIKTERIAMLYHDTFLLHDTGPRHPEHPGRLRTMIEYLRSAETLAPSLAWPVFEPASQKAIAAVHDPEYIRLVEKEITAVPPGSIAKLSTGDTAISARTWEAALLAAGAGIAGVDAVMQGSHTAAFALVRPPGHHATQDRGMGFCVFNNIAIAARYAQQHHGLERILIVDIDVHHGNGTQDIFYEDDAVFFFCIHQHPLYPGSGRSSETGQGRGKGFTLNVELPRGAGDEDALAAIKNQLAPAMVTFKPELILVSAGFDGHVDDPLGGLAYTEAGFGRMAEELRELANSYANGRIIFMLEGGYATNATARSIESILHALIN